MYVTDGNILTDCTLSGANTTKKEKKEKKEQKEQKHKKASICRISAKSGEQIKTVKPKQRLALSVFFRHELKCKASSGASEY